MVDLKLFEVNPYSVFIVNHFDELNSLFSLPCHSKIMYCVFFCHSLVSLTLTTIYYVSLSLLLIPLLIVMHWFHYFTLLFSLMMILQLSKFMEICSIIITIIAI